MIYILESDQTVRDVYCLESSMGDGWGIDFIRCNAVGKNARNLELILEFESEFYELPDFFEIDGAPVVRDSLANEVFLSYLEFVEILPLVIKFKNKTIRGFNLVNLIQEGTVIDTEQSEYNGVGPVIVRMKNLKLVKGAPNFPIFRDKKYQMAAFISADLKEKLELGRYSGLLIKEAEGWNDSHIF